MTVSSTRGPTLLLFAAAGIAVFQTIALLAWYWPGALPDTNTSGVWIALADDFARGDFYRPLAGALGTGGTRYMPVFFLLHGFAIKLGASALGSGIVITLATAVAMSVATYALSHALGIAKRYAWPLALLLFGTVSFQMMLLTVRGDFLAAALNLSGIAATVTAERKGSRSLLVVAGVLFGAAFLTKLTTLFGLIAMIGWLLGRRKTRAAMTLAASSAALMLGGVALAQSISGGRMLESFRAVASGGITIDAALQGPVRFATECIHDPLSIVLFVTAAVSVLTLGRGIPARAPVLWVAGATLAATLVIFLSPGTSANHLMDLQAASLLVIALGLGSSGAARIWSTAGIVCFTLGMCATWLPGVPSIRKFFEREGRPRVAGVRDFFERTEEEKRPILAENPVVPIVAGERPIVADWFNLRLLWQRDPALREMMLARLRAGEFGSVVLSNWPPIFATDAAFPRSSPTDEQMRALVAREDLPAGFGEALVQSYRVVEVRRPYIYLVRRQEKALHD